MIHNETAIAGYTFARFKDDLKNGIFKNRLKIDIDITEASSWKNKFDFINITHGLFIEVKGLRNDHSWTEPKRKREGFISDCEKLRKLINNEYCKYGIAIIVDQGDKDGIFIFKIQESLLMI